MRNLDYFFDDLKVMVDEAFTYTPMTDEQYQISCVNDIIEWADTIQSLWNGDDPGTLEDRAAQAADIIDKCNELKELIADME
jgi:hypothetical protein